MHRDADRARLVGDRAGDRLADPPGGVGRELVAAPPLELVDGLHQADVAFLDQVEEQESAVRVLLRDRDHEPQVRLDQLALGAVRAHRRLGQLVERAAHVVARHAHVGLALLDLAREALELRTRGADAVGAVAEAQEGGLARAALARGEHRLRRGTRRAACRRAASRAIACASRRSNSRASLRSRSVISSIRDSAKPVSRRTPTAGRSSSWISARRRCAGGVAGARVVDRAQPLRHLVVDAAQLRHRALQGSLALVDRQRAGRGLLVVEAVEQVLDREVALAMLVAEAQHLGEAERRREDGADLVLDAGLDALRDRDLALAREQRHLAHLAQVHAHGVVADAGVFVARRRRRAGERAWRPRPRCRCPRRA